jgi:TP901-1 family phage major tail protein
MAAQKGSALLIKIGDGASPEVFTTVGGLRSTTITLNDEAVDVTNKDSSGVRTLLANAGVQSMSVSGSGVFTDSTSENSIKTAFGAASFKNYQLIVPALGTWQGAFMISSLEYAGEYNGEVTYSISLESSGSITFT